MPKNIIPQTTENAWDLCIFSNDFDATSRTVILKFFTDNQVRKHFLTKRELSRREVRWLKLFADLKIEKATLVVGEEHTLGDTLSQISQKPIFLSNNLGISNSKATHANHSSLNNISESFKTNYFNDQFLGPILKKLKKEGSSKDSMESDVDSIIDLFRLRERIKYYENKAFVPRNSVRNIL